MLTDPKLRSQVDALWDKFWTGGLANPLDAIQQFAVVRAVCRVYRDIEPLRGRMPPSGVICEAGRQGDGLFEGLLAEAFGNQRSEI